MAKTEVRPGQIANELTDTDIAAANKDGADATPSMRTLGTGAGQAAKGSTTASIAYVDSNFATTTYVAANFHPKNADIIVGNFSVLVYASGSLAVTINGVESNFRTPLVLGADPAGPFTNNGRLYFWTGSTTTPVPLPNKVQLVARDYTGDGDARLCIISEASANAVHIGVGQVIADDYVQATRAIFNIATGTAPLAITSTTVCANLNADMVDGLHASSFVSAVSPAFTGTPTAPTAGINTSNTQIATTAFVNAEIIQDALVKAGVAGGQTAYGGTVDNNALVLQGSSTGKGQVRIERGFGLYGNLILTLAVNPNNYNPTDGPSYINWNISPSGDNRLITGIDSTLIPVGRMHFINNVGAEGYDIILKHENASSTSTNRFQLPNAIDFRIAQYGTAIIWYDYGTGGNRWRVLGQAGWRLDVNGVAGGQTIYGGTAVGDSLFLGGSTSGGAVNLQDSFFIAQFITPAAITGTQNNYDPSNSQFCYQMRISSDAARSITGLSQSSWSGYHGRMVMLTNVGSFDITLNHENIGSTAAYRFYFQNGRDFMLNPGCSIALFYDSIQSRWLRQGDAAETPLPAKYRQGLLWKANATDPVNDIEVAPGSCRDDADTCNLVLTTTMIKRLDANWVAGNNQGGLDTGTKTAYYWNYIYLIYNPTTFVTDILFSVSGSPTMPSGFTKKRMIGGVRLNASVGIMTVKCYEMGPGNIYVQLLDLNNVGLEVSAADCTTTRTNRNIYNIPQVVAGVRFNANVLIDHASGQAAVFISNPDMVDVAPSLTTVPLAQLRMPAAAIETSSNMELTTSAGLLISDRSTLTATTLRIQVLGYWWPLI